MTRLILYVWFKVFDGCGMWVFHEYFGVPKWGGVGCVHCRDDKLRWFGSFKLGESINIVVAKHT